jgi:hypothetical protein
MFFFRHDDSTSHISHGLSLMSLSLLCAFHHLNQAPKMTSQVFKTPTATCISLMTNMFMGVLHTCEAKFMVIFNLGLIDPCVCIFLNAQLVLMTAP